jgi:hypothetical protein
MASRFFSWIKKYDTKKKVRKAVQKEEQKKWEGSLVKSRSPMNPEADRGVGPAGHCISAGVML